jgi:drug/metabolite transporter (DMT)-like permease
MSVTVTIPTSKSWKTTLAGALAALGAYLVTQDGVYKIVGQALVIGAPFLLGLFAKDSNVTGGSVVDAPIATPAITDVTPTVE